MEDRIAAQRREITDLQRCHDALPRGRPTDERKFPALKEQSARWKTG